MNSSGHLVCLLILWWGGCRTAMAAAAPEEDEGLAVDTGDLMHLRRLVEEKDGGPAWIHMMDKTLPTMRYQAWRRDPEVVLLNPV